MSKVHFVLDEMALIGHLNCIEDALGLGRGYAIRLQIYLQSLSQLGKCFPQGQEQTVLNNTTQVYFGINDNTAELVSTRLGDATIIVESGGTSGSHTYQRSEGIQPPSRSDSSSWNSNWQQQARRLLKTEEVSALSPRTAITFAPGVPPIRTELIRYYEERRPDNGRTGFRGRIGACGALLAAFTYFVVVTGMAVVATLAFLFPI